MFKFDQPLNYPGKYQSLKKTFKCPICGSEFIKKAPNQKYCSKECAYKKALENNKKWQEAHKEQMRTRQRQYRKEHRDRMRKYQQEYRKNNPHVRERDRKYSLEWRRKNRDYVIQYAAHSRCSKKYDNCQSCPYDDCIKA